MAIINGDNAGNNLVGTNDKDEIFGLGGDDIISGLGGDDVLDGGIGKDTLKGGAGNDLYFVDDAVDSIDEEANEGTDEVVASISFTLGANLENLSLTGIANLKGTGNTLDNSIFGNDGNNLLLGAVGNDTLNGEEGNDTLDGGIGADEMTGGIGNDAYIVDSAGDTVTEQLNDGNDTVFSSVTFTLGANVEFLALTGSAKIDGTGNDANNEIFGNVHDNKLSGAGGVDDLLGGGGNDTLDGGEGQDFLIGGDGNDTLTGGEEGDSFDFNTLDGSVDTVTDFAVGENGDVLDISDLLIGYDEGVDDLDDFVQFVQQGADTVVRIDADGDGGGFTDIALLQNVNPAAIIVADNVVAD